MKQRIAYISLFAILYLIVAFSSFWHAIEFFSLTNQTWMGLILAFAFEIGQAAVLLSILTDVKSRTKITSWSLMTMLTLVQIIGNVYSSYKYIMLHNIENLKYFKEPIFIWMNLPDDEATVIIVYLSAAILPITALLLTSMVTNYLHSNIDDTNIDDTNIDNTFNEQEEPVNKEPLNKEPVNKESIEEESTSSVPIVEKKQSKFIN